jgi:hypothetical protein
MLSFWIAGLLLAIGATGLAFFRRDVSLGHAAIVAAGAALIAIPYVADFEWTDHGVKFTTRDQGAELTAQLAATNKEIESVRSDLAKVTAALQKNSERIATLESKAGVGANSGTGEYGTYDKSFFDNLLKQNQDAKRATTLRLQKLDQLKETFQPTPFRASPDIQ